MIDDLHVAAQTLIAGMQPRYSYDQGDLTMLIMDMPDVPPQYAPIVVAQKSQAAQPTKERTIGVCHPIENKPESRLSAINSISPLGEASSYLENIEHKKIDWSLVKSTIKMTLLQAPAHGKLELFEAQQAGSYDSTDYNYEGPDRATVLVEIGGYKVKVIYHFVLMKNVPGSGDEGEATDDKTICPNGYMWKISFNPDDPNAPVYTVQNKKGTDLFIQVKRNSNSPAIQRRLKSFLSQPFSQLHPQPNPFPATNSVVTGF